MNSLINTDHGFKKFLQTVGTNLHALRTEHDLKIETVATETKIAPRLLRQIEKGEHNMRLELLGRLCHFYKVSLQDIATQKKNVVKLNAISLFMGAFLIPISSGLVPVISNTENDVTESLLALEDSEILFADRMKIELEKGSKITYPTIGNGKDFTVSLLGAAQFEIMRGYRLTVNCNDINVKATAASFSIEKGDGTIEVIVNKNEVFIVTGQQQLVVRTFQRATYSVSTKRISIVDTRIKRT
jgi:transcriptional regulator with XRE-family HTH domain